MHEDIAALANSNRLVQASGPRNKRRDWAVPPDQEGRMRVVVIGAGGIRGTGASLAKAGADVTFVARGAHLAAIRENGSIRRSGSDPPDRHLLANDLWRTGRPDQRAR